jgi:hypothetical protein
MACGGPNQAPCGGPVPRAAADCGCTQPVQGACPATTWIAGPWRYTQSTTGCVTREAVGAPIADGVYTHPRITMQGGHLVAIESGASALAMVPALCAPNNLATAGPAGTIVLSADQCNLTTMVGGRYLTKVALTTPSGSPLTVTGCGTPASPFVLDVTLPGTTSGTSFVGPGITFANGIATAFSLPVMNVTVTPETRLQAAWNPLTGTVAITPTAGADVKLPALLCDSAANPTNALVVGTPSTVYEFRLPNTATVLYTATTGGAGTTTVNGMVTGMYEVRANGLSLGYLSYNRCAYIAPP